MGLIVTPSKVLPRVNGGGYTDKAYEQSVNPVISPRLDPRRLIKGGVQCGIEIRCTTPAALAQTLATDPPWKSRACACAHVATRLRTPEVG